MGSIHSLREGGSRVFQGQEGRWLEIQKNSSGGLKEAGQDCNQDCTHPPSPMLVPGVQVKTTPSNRIMEDAEKEGPMDTYICHRGKPWAKSVDALGTIEDQAKVSQDLLDTEVYPIGGLP